MQPNQTQLDPDVVRLAQSIRKIESGDNFTARGKSGEFGGYQYTPDTWNARAPKYLGRQVALEAATPAEQNEVQYKWMKEKKDAGFTPGQIASMHNAGEGRPNAYKEGFKGTNDFGVEYDVPAYAEKVMKQYQTLKGGAGGSLQAPQGGVSQQATGYAPPKPPKPYMPEMGGAEGGSTGNMTEGKGIVQQGLEFFFPILEQKERTGLQTVGDVALSALSLIPGAGLVGAGAKGLRAASLAGKAAKLGETAGLVEKASPFLTKSNVIKGAGLGYGGDVASSLSQGETEAGDILMPGAGTAVGGLAGGVLSMAKNLAPGFLSGTSGVPKEVLERFADDPTAARIIIKAGTSPKAARDVAVGAVKDFRKNLSSEWETGVDDLVKKYDGVRTGLPENVGNELKDIASRYNTSTNTRINIPQNPLNMSAKELTTLIKDLNAIKYNPVSPDVALSDMKKYLKELGKKSFNEGEEFTNLYANYATKKEILDAAEDIVRAYKAKSPTQVTTSINRLQSVFDEGKGEYLTAIQALEQATGKDILSHVIANKVSGMAPTNMKAGLQVDDLLQWLGIAVTSPRGAAELTRLLTGSMQGIVPSTLRSAGTSIPLLPGLIDRQ